MRFFRACLTVLIFSILAAVPLAHAQKRVALVIGNSAYQHTPTLRIPSMMRRPWSRAQEARIPCNGGVQSQQSRL